MERMEIDISRIQETHNTSTDGKIIRAYVYISAGAQKIAGMLHEKEYGGVAITILREWGANIQKITRRSHRNIQISLQTGFKSKTLQILNTYAPHMSYNQENAMNIGKKPKTRYKH